MKKTLLILSITFCLNTNAQNINTIAGNGTSGYAGDGAAATSAEFRGTIGVFVDGSGNVFIADNINSRIRKVNGSTGIITTIAGNGTSGYGGDGGAATSAKLNEPAGIFVDGSGNVFIADYLNNRIRKVNGSTGIITTIAGSGTSGLGDGAAATSAQLFQPAGVFVDGSGNVFIADGNNSRIRKVNGSTGIITTIAGGGTSGLGDGGAATSAQLYSPSGVFVDGSGNLFIADLGNKRIRKVTASTGIITTIAGNGTLGYAGDGGAATSAALNGPVDVFVDGSGDVFIADYFNHRIRKVNNSTGIITTVAGNGTQGYSGDGGLATSAALNQPQGVFVDGLGNMFIADFTNNRIRKVDGGTTTGINDLTKTPTISIYPNPTAGDFTLITPNLLNANVEIYNCIGQLISKKNLTEKNTKLSISEKVNGIYFIKVVEEGINIFNSKIVKD